MYIMNVLWTTCMNYGQHDLTTVLTPSITLCSGMLDPQESSDAEPRSEKELIVRPLEFCMLYTVCFLLI